VEVVACSTRVVKPFNNCGSWFAIHGVTLTKDIQRWAMCQCAAQRPTENT
jgi:hypothetical protein